MLKLCPRIIGSLKEEGKLKKYLFAIVIALTITFTYSSISFAACGGGPIIFFCNTAAPNPDPNGIQETGNPANLSIDVMPGAGIDTRISSGGNGLEGIDADNGNNVITIKNASVIGQSNAIDKSNGTLDMTITDSLITHVNNNTININSGDGSEIRIERSMVINPDGRVLSINSDPGVTNNLYIIDSEVKTLDTTGEAFDGGSGMDNVFVENSIMQGGLDGSVIPDAIDVGDGDDSVTLSNGADLRGLTPSGIGPGLIDCGADFDTITFTMNVPPQFLAQAQANLAAATVPDGSVTINGLFYTWVGCDLLVDELQAGPVGDIRPIPTLSEWGLIAMAGVLGIVGFIAIQRRKVTA